MEAEEIKRIRGNLNMTQKELANAIGVDQVTVNRWENKKAKPHRLAIKQIKRLKSRKGG